jgi:acyl-CoA reductase-like NAD-dependent aldehyde dehydrogenase/nicotinamidase-related amidase
MKPALLLVDCQTDYLAAAGLHPAADQLVERAARLLDAWRQRRLPVIHLWTTIRRETDQRLPHWKMNGRWQCEENTPGHQPPPSLRPRSDEAVVHKTGFNGFASGQLDEELARLGCDTLVLAGLHLHACVRTAAVEALERGLTVRIAEDAVASDDPIHAAATRRWLAARCVAFQPAARLLAPDADADTARAGWVHYSPRHSREALFEIPNATPAEQADAVSAAQEAGRHWRRTPMARRLELLERIAARLEAAALGLARQMAVELGKPLAHGLEETRRAAANIRDVARRAAARPLTRREAAGLVRDEPLGVVALVSAWNNPVAIPLGKLAPALAYGNTVVWKPAPAATRVARALQRLLNDAGVAPGTVQLLTGDHATAQQLAAAPGVDAVTLTGSLAAGQALQEICARRLVPLQAELSGNNAAIVWSDADFASAAEQVAWGAFAFAGQRCTANRRVIARAEDADRLVEAVQAAAEKLRLGDPLDAQTDIGPVLHTGKRDEVQSLLQRAEAVGAARFVIRTHARVADEDWARAGAYLAPAIVGCDEPGHALVQEESMAPVLVVQRARDFDEALALCNGVRHGLIASLFSASPARQEQFLAEARAGMLKLNSATAGVDVTLPFGGWKASGLGPPEHGEADVTAYTRLQTLYLTPSTPQP